MKKVIALVIFIEKESKGNTCLAIGPMSEPSYGRWIGRYSAELGRMGGINEIRIEKITLLSPERATHMFLNLADDPVVYPDRRKM